MADIFSLENTQRIVRANLDEAAAAVPEGRKSALMIDATTDGQLRLVYAVKGKKGWDFGLGAGYDGHHVSGKVSVLKTWS